MSLIDAPISITGLFSEEDEHADSLVDNSQVQSEFEEVYEVQSIEVGGKSLSIRQFSFHPQNANRIWRGTFVLSDYLIDLAERNRNFKQSCILELGSATGVLAISLTLNGFTSLVTSDVDDQQVETNIRHNCNLNGVEPLPHIGHNWGDDWPLEENNCYDYIIASDILLYINFYVPLVNTLSSLMKNKPNVTFIMSWQRRMKESLTFFQLMAEAGFSITDEGRRVYTFCYGSEISTVAKGDRYKYV
mmetsp:Transcript_30122/g.39667  ORF Transcript_30122/g.39667 Transcript_30122/m.39667 type:complete len:246 (-) Transcript_30122:528-1265(-)